MNSTHHSIGGVEKETGLSKDVLRVWERRYGFPSPHRDGSGERLYPQDQVDKLRMIKRLLDQGHRPGKLINASMEMLSTLTPRLPATSPDSRDRDLSDLLRQIRHHDANGYLEAMQKRLAEEGLERFVKLTVAPLASEVGEAWETGKIEIFEEHLFTELTKRIIRQAIIALPRGSQRPRILLTSVPNELHVLGLLLAEALFALEGAECIPFGAQMPLLEIVRAAQAHRADIVALSFSLVFPTRQIPRLLQQLRLSLPTSTALWVGGAGVSRITAPPGVRLIPELDEAQEALQNWRDTHT